MTKIDKLIARLLRKPTDFTWDELVKVLAYHGFEERTKGKTGGSRRAFVNVKTGQIISLHKPHPENTVKRYILDQVLMTLDLSDDE
ncbi:type II toxin-antitoxin system HicA family toxin [Fibrella sp. HMF5036]|uniref:Type II toxin-antitoxin system HicA family toxin n=2 Tax=Fibrella aquatilis TaxID=2817059 RepID=A0A939K0T4_9BACT|nr:type II toxin-antitoxin system HicA family toxin [Fibrella aquatilis]